MWLLDESSPQTKGRRQTSIRGFPWHNAWKNEDSLYNWTECFLCPCLIFYMRLYLKKTFQTFIPFLTNCSKSITAWRLLIKISEILGIRSVCRVNWRNLCQPESFCLGPILYTFVCTVESGVKLVNTVLRSTHQQSHGFTPSHLGRKF